MDRLTVLDLFIVNSINRGICTAYDLQRRAGISPGASNPALKRLEKAGVIARTTATTSRRRRFEFKVTPEGDRQFRRGWREYLSAKNPVEDIDSILRILDIASHNRAKAAAIRGFLDRVIDYRWRLARLGAVAPRSAALPEYRELRERFDAKRYKFEAAVLTELRREIFKEAGKRPRRRRRVQS